MAREIKQITLLDGSEQKTFKIQQMSAWKAQKWMAKFILLIGGGDNMSIDTLKNGDWGAVLATISNKPFEKVEELIGELLSCCSIIRDGNVHIALNPTNIDSQIDSVDCLMQLEKEAFTFNNFFGGMGMNGSGESPSHEMPTITIPK